MAGGLLVERSSDFLLGVGRTNPRAVAGAQALLDAIECFLDAGNVGLAQKYLHRFKREMLLVEVLDDLPKLAEESRRLWRRVSCWMTL